MSLVNWHLRGRSARALFPLARPYVKIMLGNTFTVDFQELLVAGKP